MTKFKAWDEGKKVWHYNFQYIKSREEDNDWILFTSDTQPLEKKQNSLDNPYFQQQFKICQYLGINDINDCEIYENDILLIDGEEIIVPKIADLILNNLASDYQLGEVKGTIYDNTGWNQVSSTNYLSTIINKNSFSIETLKTKFLIRLMVDYLITKYDFKNYNFRVNNKEYYISDILNDNYDDYTAEIFIKDCKGKELVTYNINFEDNMIAYNIKIKKKKELRNFCISILKDNYKEVS